MRRSEPNLTGAAHDVTALLHAWSDGDIDARDRLVTLIYQELRRRAAAHLRRERRDHTLQPTALVNEAYLRLVDQRAPWQNRQQFFCVASQIMRWRSTATSPVRAARSLLLATRGTLESPLSSTSIAPEGKRLRSRGP